ncbi:MAG: LysR family transcriptional regulator [Ruminococcaceae bacterium]|nr:LysR family transcriptional regulator [Oscillospiraceae bacterium]
MDLQGLNIFVHVAELNSFTKAGEMLGFSQPTISFQIKQLETELGVQLFDRIGHTIKLTDAGRKALAYAQKICNTSKEMLQGNIADKEITGTVRMATADSLCTPLIANWYAGFKEKYPNISLNIKTAGTGDLFKLIDHNEADVVCTLDSHIYDTNYVIVSEEKIGVHFVVSKLNPLAVKKNVNINDLLLQPFLLTEKGMSYRRILDEELAKHSIEIKPVLEISSADIICRFVAANVGVSFLPDYVTENAVNLGEIVRLNVKDFDINVWKQLLHHKDKWISAPMKIVMEEMSKIILSERYVE